MLLGRDLSVLHIVTHSLGSWTYCAQVALLQALGAIVAALDNVDDEVLRLCSLAANRIVTGWIYLWPEAVPPLRTAPLPGF